MDSEGTSATHDPSLSGVSTRNRIANACVQCQRLKRRCDGGKPACQHCAKLDKPCQYAERRRRGPGKKKEHIENLEERLRKVESSLQDHSEQLPAHDDVITDPPSLYSDANPIIIQSSTNQIYPSVSHEPSLFNLSLSEMNNVTGPEILTTKIAELSSHSNPFDSTLFGRINKTAREMRTTTDKGPFYGRVFVRLPAQPLLEDLLQPAIEKLQLHGPLLSRDEFLKLVSDQYAAGADCMANPSRWVILNCFMPLALHHRAARGALPGLTTTAWSFFKNAFSVYPELLIQGNDPSACEALLAMAMFLLGTAEARTTLQVTAAVARMVHSLGLHKPRYYRNLEDSEAERCRHIFWMAYIMNEDMTQKYGLPSPFGNEAPALQLPSENISGEMIPGYLRKLAELAVLQSRVSSVSITQKSLKEVGDGILDQGTVTFGDLKSWKKELPWNMQESAGGSEKELSMPVALLHFRYHSCVTKLHMRVAHILVTNDTSSTTDGSGMSDHTRLTYKLAKGLATSAARNTMSVVRQLPLEPYCQVWEMMCYPVSAVLLLLSTILEDPSASQAKSDAEIIGDFVGYLERLVAAKSDVWKLLDGCSRIHKIAECAVDLHQRGRIPFSPEEASSEDEAREKLEAIRAKLSPVTDWLYLAQGLLSNLDALRIDAEDTLSDICGMESPDGLYGAFTPEFIKSYSNNFLFAH